MGAQRPVRAAILVSAAIFLFGLMEVIVKAVGPSVGVLELVWARYAVHLGIVVAVLAPRAGAGVLRTRRRFLQIGRSGFLFGVTITNWFALQYLPLADVAAVVQLSPVLVTAIAAVLLHERVTRQHWVAVAIGLIGVILLVRPGGALFTPLIVLPFATAVCYAAYQISTRALGSTESQASTVFYTAVVGFVVLIPVVPIVWVAPSGPDLVLIACLGVLAATSQFLFIVGFRLAPASSLAPLAYTQLVWAAVFGALVFGDVPEPLTIVAMVVIVIAGLLAIRATRTPVTPAPIVDDGRPAT